MHFCSSTYKRSLHLPDQRLVFPSDESILMRTKSALIVIKESWEMSFDSANFPPTLLNSVRSSFLLSVLFLFLSFFLLCLSFLSLFSYCQLVTLLQPRQGRASIYITERKIDEFRDYLGQPQQYYRYLQPKIFKGFPIKIIIVNFVKIVHFSTFRFF